MIPMNNEIKKTKKLNNKGFSLVELIIVIAIMAVLVGVLAPQYLKFVERSRAASDRDNYDAIVSAIQVYGADVDATVAPAAETLTITRTNATMPGDTTFIGAALRAAGIDSISTLVNRTTFAQVSIVVTVDGTTGQIHVVATES